MYEREISELEKELQELKTKQGLLSTRLTWEEACVYLAGPDSMTVKDLVGGQYRGYPGIGILYTTHVIDHDPDPGYWRV